MERANFALAQELAAQDHELHLVAHRVADELLCRPNVRWRHVARPFGADLLGMSSLNRVGQQVAAQNAPRGGRVIVNGGNCYWPDINWVHYVHAAYWPQAGGSLPRRGQRRLSHRLFLRQERRAIIGARAVIAVSAQVKQDLVTHLGLAPESVRVIYHGVDAALFQPLTPEQRTRARRALNWPASRLKVVFVGALGDRRKGFDLLFAAWQQLCRDQSWDADLVVIGSGAEARTWQRRAQEAQLHERIEFLGQRNDVEKLLGLCDALVSPTRYEPYGLAAHEALCCGIPAFITSAAGVAECYPPELNDLLLAAPPGVSNIVTSLRSWRLAVEDYGERAARFGANLRQYGWCDSARKIVALLDTV
jgi:glycosyltransferase involved in cell wall biosynthesis